ncbi:MAG: MFS transporter [Actinobacteria bacterium]|nr:MFS transporter [Actinomycetota bacterium]
MTQGRRTLLVGMMLAVFTIAFQAMGLATALPTLMASFDAEALYPWAFTTMISGMLAATIVAGRVADQHGPTLPMYLGFALFALGLVLGWLAPSVWVVLLARLVQGLGAGALNLTLAVTVAHGFSPAERPRVMALYSFCWLLPAFIGPPIAAWLTHYDWRLVFATVLPLVAVAFVILLPGLRQVQSAFHPGEDEVGPVAVWPTIAITVAPSLILLAGQPLGWWRLASAVAGVAALVWGLPRILAPAAQGFGPGIPSVVLTRALQAGSFFAAETILLVTLQNLRGYSPTEVGWALTVGSIGWTAGSWLQSQRWLRWHRNSYITIGALTTVLGLAGLVGYAWFPLPLGFGLSAWVLAGLGMGFTMPSSAVAVMSLSSSFEQGRNQSSMQVAESVGNSVVTAVAGGIYTALLLAKPAELSYSAALAMTLLIAIAAVFLSLRIGRIRNDLLA